MIHRDIKLDNIIVTKEGQACIIDFGLGRVLFEGESLSDRVGSIAGMSPQVVQRLPYDHRTDIWSLGIILYGLLSGKLPFLNDNPTQTWRNIVGADLNF